MLRATIRHDSPSRSIMAYLASIDGAVAHARIVAYMALMHYVSENLTCVTLKHLKDRGQIERVRRGCYQSRWEFV